jgi:tRNA dimethylallyltransferase
MVAAGESERPRIVIVLGPTAAGKSKLGIDLAEALGGEIINADSMQVYRYMDIGTAKPTPEERTSVPHHLIDVVNPDEPFHADLYRALGRRAIDSLVRIGKPILVVGGTGLYIRSLTQGLFTSPRVEPGVRERLKQEAREQGEPGLYERLQRVDPRTASSLHPHDLFRIIRALEVFESTGVPISFYRERHRFGEKPYHTLKVGLEMDRQDLYARIDRRVEGMIEQGFLQEVEGLLNRGYGPELKSMRSLGYKQGVQYLMKKIPWDEAVREIKSETRHYAKRQWTWFKADREIRWMDALTKEREIFSEVKAFLGEKPGRAET